MLYRLLECNHDLRARLAHRECDAVKADIIVREVTAARTRWSLTAVCQSVLSMVLELLHRVCCYATHVRVSIV